MDDGSDPVDDVIENESNVDNELSPAVNEEADAAQEDTGEPIIEPNPKQIDEEDDNNDVDNLLGAGDNEAIEKTDGDRLDQADDSSLFDLEMPAGIDDNPLVPLEPEESQSSSSLPDVPEPVDMPLDDDPHDAVLGLDDFPANTGEDEVPEIALDQHAGRDDGVVANLDELSNDAAAEVEGVDPPLDQMTGEDDLDLDDVQKDADDSLEATEEEKHAELADDDDNVQEENEDGVGHLSDDGENPVDEEDDGEKEVMVDEPEESQENDDVAAAGGDGDMETKALDDIDTQVSHADDEAIDEAKVNDDTGTQIDPPNPAIAPSDTVNLDSDGDSRDAVIPVLDDPEDADKTNTEDDDAVIVPDERMDVDVDVDEKQDDNAMDVEITHGSGSKGDDGQTIGDDDKNFDDIMVLDTEPVEEKKVDDKQSKPSESDNDIVDLDSESVADEKIVESKDDKPADDDDIVDLDSECGDEKKTEPEKTANTNSAEDSKLKESKQADKETAGTVANGMSAGGDNKLKNGEVLSGESLSKVVSDENNDSGLKIVAVSTGVKKEQVQMDQVQIKNEIDDALADIKATEQKKADLSKIQTCIVCQLITKCKYNIVRNGDIKHLCDDACFKQFRRTPTRFLRTAEPAPVSAPAASEKAAPDLSSFKTCCVCQLLSINKGNAFISWMGNDFCGAGCQQKFKVNLGTCCCYCASYITMEKCGKFCLRVGNEVRPFCSDKCLQEKKSRMKICTNCKKDLAGDSDAFVAPIGNNSEFKDFCTPECLTAYEEKLKKGLTEKTKPIEVPKSDDNDIEILKVQPGDGRKAKLMNNCAVCGKMTKMKHELKYEGKLHQMCSDPCLSAFQYAHKLNASTCRCETCGQMCFREGAVPKFIQFEGQQRRFCSSKCIMNFHEGHKKTVSCAWCGTRKYNFDMIERLDANNKFQLFCSLNCLSLYRVNLQATSNNMIPCDQCHKQAPAQYHLTMSDASVRNFCTYPCVMNFQTHFNANNAGKGKTVVTGTKTGQAPSQKLMTSQPIVNKAAIAAATAVSTSKMVTRGVTKKVPNTIQGSVMKTSTAAQAGQTSASMPMISNVISLAPQGAQGKTQTVTIRSPTGPMPVVVTSQSQQIKTTLNAKSQQVQQQIIIQPPPPKQVKNKALLCKPFVQTKATSCRPHVQTKETQTDAVPLEKMFIPVPVPFFIPTPMAMYAAPAPIPIAFPVPIPIPIFIPTTKKNGPKILKHIKEIREKIPSDPLEAEMLRMAEAVASDKKEPDSSSDSEAEEKEEETAMTPVYDNPEEAAAVSASPSDYLKGVDLEASLDPSIIANNTHMAANFEPPAAPMSDGDGDEDNVDQIDMLADGDEDDDWTPEPPTTRASPRRATPARSRARRPPKRTSSSVGRRRSKRSRVDDDTPPDLEPAADSPTPTLPPELAPDSGLALKYTYGVNAWRNWVKVKNTQAIPRSSKVKKFKTDLLHCSSDELNFSLRLFVNEVRKPNGDTYAGDSIFYLCLGIQQYLYENGRIDNIFTDQCYSDFSNTLNDHVILSVPRLNPAGQLVCRIEEEHLWESKQLGAHSPNILLNTLVYFNTKYFMLKTVQEHNDLGFLHILKHWRKTETPQGIGRAVYLRFYCTTAQKEVSDAKGRKKDEVPVYEQTESFENPLRCPVKLYEFYLSKCPEGVKLRKDMFYLVPERSCVPDSPVWFSAGKLDTDYLAKLLNRVLMVKEVQEAHLGSKPVYISIKN